MKRLLVRLTFLTSVIFNLLAISSQRLLAQLDTTSFPLNIGNKWYYRYEYTEGSFHTLHVRVKEIVDTTSTGTRLVRVTRLGQDSITLATEQWTVTNGSLSANSMLLYNASLTHDTSWIDYVPFGMYSFTYQLRRVALFGLNTRCQFYLTSFSYFTSFGSGDRRTAMGIGPYYDYFGAFPGQGSRFDQYYSLIALLKNGQLYGDTVLTSVDDREDVMPTAFALYQNYPNPFNPATTIVYKTSQPTHVTITVYDVNGKEISQPVNAECEAGTYRVSFDARTLASGVYYYTMKTPLFTATKQMILLK